MTYWLPGCGGTAGQAPWGHPLQTDPHTAPMAAGRVHLSPFPTIRECQG